MTDKSDDEIEMTLKCWPSATYEAGSVGWAGWNTVKGWECPRCAKINAPFVTACSCTPSSYASAGPVWTVPGMPPGTVYLTTDNSTATIKGLSELAAVN